ncbi:MATR3 protein, partial [Atractosteus spatula]|nr:MATR3 protein [Atractosteus spatula]
MAENLPLGSDKEAFTAGCDVSASPETLNMDVSEEHAQNTYSEPPELSHSTVSLEVASKSQESHPSPSSGENTNALNLFATLGLSPEDLDALAQIPENKITVETLPHLIMQLKAKKSARGHSSDHRSQHSASPPREQQYKPSEDKWEDVGPSSRPTRSSSKSPVHSYVVDYNYGKYGREDRADRAREDRDLRYSKPSHERPYVESRPRSPSSFEVDDFHGLMPRSFPHVCSLCDFDVNSSRAWSQHINGVRHAENRRDLLRMYPGWDPQFISNRMPDSYPPDDLLSSGRAGSRSSSSQRRPYSSDRSAGNKNKHRTRVVVTKFPKGTLDVKDLLKLAEPFGTVVKHLVFPCKGFLEMSTHKEAVTVVNHYQKKPFFVKDIKLLIYLSPVVESIKTPRLDVPEKHSKNQGYAVVCVSHLPAGKDIESELIDVAKLFGEVQCSKFSTNEALIEMADFEDAEIMVKYYSSNMLRINGKSVKVKLWTTHKRLRMSPDSAPSRRGEVSRRHSSKHRSEESSRSSHSRNKERTPTRGDSTEKKEDHTGEEEKSDDEHKHEDDVLGELDVEVDEGDKGMMVEEDEDDAKEDVAQDDVASWTPGEEPAETSVEGVETEADGPERKSPDSAEVLMEQNLEEKSQESSKELCGNTEAKPGENSHSQDLMKELPVESAENSEIPKEELVKEEAPSTEEKEAVESNECEEMLEMDFPENLDDFVTLDELDEDAENSENKSEKESEVSSSSKAFSDDNAGRVVVIKDFRRGYGSKEDIFYLAKPFGKVTKHLIQYYKNEALLELPTKEAASKMVEFYSTTKMALVCGKPVTISLWLEKEDGRSVFITMLPFVKFSDYSLLRIAQPFGKVTAYCLNWTYKRCYIQMDTTEAAQKMVKTYSRYPPKFYGRFLHVYLCRKSDALIPWKMPPPEHDKKPAKRERTESSRSEEDAPSSSQSKAKAKEEGPTTKKLCTREDKGSAERTASKEQQESAVKKNEQGEAADSEEKNSDAPDTSQKTLGEGAAESSEVGELSEQNGSGAASSNGESSQACDKDEPERKTPVPLGPYQPNNPVGLDYIIPKVGYFCQLCSLFYTSEKTAKTVHCSSLSHYQKLKVKVFSGLLLLDVNCRNTFLLTHKQHTFISTMLMLFSILMEM